MLKVTYDRVRLEVVLFQGRGAAMGAALWLLLAVLTPLLAKFLLFVAVERRYFFVVPMNVGRWAKPDQSMYCFFMSFVFVYFYFISCVMTKVSMLGAREIIRT